MPWVFWSAVGLILYTYIGYVAWLWVRSRWHRRRVDSAPYFPFISIVLVVRNESARLREKLYDLLQLAYPTDRAEIIAVSDGSNDDTNQILLEFAKISGIKTILNQQHRGKAVALNDAIRVATGEIVVFTDARQKIETNAVLRLMKNFADSSVGCVSGELMLGDPVGGEVTRRIGLYWKFEKFVREIEAASGSIVGATGALYAVRRSLLVPLPPETILDDVFIPMQVVRQGARVIVDSRARVWDLPDLGMKREFARKVRTLSGIYQLIWTQPWLLGRANPLRFEFISHKLLRLAVPFALCAALVASAFLHPLVYRAALLLQLGFYSLIMLRLLPMRNPLTRIADVAFTFILLNAAALVAFGNFVSGRKPAWGR